MTATDGKGLPNSPFIIRPHHEHTQLNQPKQHYLCDSGHIVCCARLNWHLHCNTNSKIHNTFERIHFMADYASSALDILQVKSILRTIEARMHVQIQMDEASSSAQCLILGADLHSGELLLSETYPDTAQLFHGHIIQRRLWLRLKSGERYLSLKTTVLSREAGLLSIRIDTAHWTTNRRWQNRAKFTDLRGPKVRLNQEFAPNLNGFISNISAQGLALDIWGKEVNREFHVGQNVQPTLLFNDHFEVIISAYVQSTLFYRSPSCHTRLRLRFAELNEITRSQIINFIDSIESAQPYIESAA